jgi:hypothetical protein
MKEEIQFALSEQAALAKLVILFDLAFAFPLF